MIKREELRQEFDSIREKQAKLNSRLNRLSKALRATTDELAELYLKENILITTQTTIKGIVNVVLSDDAVYLVEGRNPYNGPLSLRAKVSYEDYIKLEQHKLDSNVIEEN